MVGQDVLIAILKDPVGSQELKQRDVRLRDSSEHSRYFNLLNVVNRSCSNQVPSALRVARQNPKF